VVWGHKLTMLGALEEYAKGERKQAKNLLIDELPLAEKYA